MTLVLAANVSDPLFVVVAITIISFIWFLKPESKY